MPLKPNQKHKNHLLLAVTALFVGLALLQQGSIGWAASKSASFTVRCVVPEQIQMASQTATPLNATVTPSKTSFSATEDIYLQNGTKVKRTTTTAL